MTESLRIYEIGYLIVPTVTDEVAVAEHAWLTKILTSQKAEVISEGLPTKKELAYSMRKKIDGQYRVFPDAYFAWIKFSLSPEAIALVKKELDQKENILRHMIITTVRENTMAPEKLYLKDEKEEGTPTPVIEEVAQPEAPIAEEKSS